MDKPKRRRNLKFHIHQCAICQHPEKANIELDYLHCIPFSQILQRYELNQNHQIIRHAKATGLDEKRDRKSWYWRIMESFDFKKISAAEAIEAAKQLDRLEHKLVDNPVPTQLSVMYQFPALPNGAQTIVPPIKDAVDAIKELSIQRSLDAGSIANPEKSNPNRLSSSSDAAQIPPKP